jgi:diaminopimelate epimerase
VNKPQPLRCFKYQALANDYLVIDPARTPFAPVAPRIVALCRRHLGVGADGVLVGPLPVEDDPGTFGLRIFNADGSEAEQSGNGLRIFARYLLDAGYVTRSTCRIRTLRGTAEATFLNADGSLIQVDMGSPDFHAGAIPFTGLAPRLEVVACPLHTSVGVATVTALSLGNPHCVLIRPRVTPALACRLGPELERHPHFPDRVNVQFVQVVDRRHLQLEIWERGAGWTQASGSSSCAAAAAGRRLGLVEDRVTVSMPGGTLQVCCTDQGRILLTGPVQPVFQVQLPSAWPS